MKNHYETLEVVETSTTIEIKQSYKKLAKIHHPDVGGDIEKFKEINEAYSILSNEGKRNMYDLSRKQKPNGFEHFNNFNQHYQQFTYTVAFYITLKEAYTGVSNRQINFNGLNFPLTITRGVSNNSSIVIPNAGPNNSNLEVRIRILPDEVVNQTNLLDLEIKLEIDLIDAICGCEKDITLWETENIGKVKIPQGVSSGQKIRLKNKGMFNERYKTSGDLFLIIKVKIPTYDSLTPEFQECLNKIKEKRE
jgi:curved DNA-binding protein